MGTVKGGIDKRGEGLRVVRKRGKVKGRIGKG